MEPMTTALKTKTQEQETKKLPHCPHCNSYDVYGISRVVGYYSRIENWNKSKQAELRDRQRGSYEVS